MPSELKDSLTSSLLSEEVQQRQIGFWKTDGMPGVINGSRVGDTSLASSPLQNPHTLRRFDVPNLYLNQDQIALAQRPFHNKLNGPNLDINSKITVTGDHYENGLFSSSLSDLFTRKLRLSANSNNMLYGQSVGAAASHSHYKEEETEPFESLEEIEAQTIGNLLPDDDDLLSGVTDGFDGCKVQPDDAEEVDFFSSVGGMELGDDPHPHGEHPSRTLFVRNINSDVEDSELKILLEQYGDIHTLYTACKHRGFVMVSYYDIRASRRAMQALQNKPLRRRNLDIHYSVPKEATALLQMGSDFPRDISVSGMAVGGGSSSQLLDDSLHNQLKYNNYHPHSLPNGLTNTMAAAATLNGRIPEQFNRRNSVELNENVFGQASGSPATHHYMWNHHSQQPMWPNSPSLMNGVSNATTHRNNTFLHMNNNMYNNHHVGSAPSVNPSIWDRRRTFASGESHSPDASAFHPASLGPHPLEFVPHHNNMFPRPQNIGLVSHHQNHNQNSVMFPTRGQMIPIINSFDSPRTRRNESQPDNKKQFELDLDRIMRGDDKRTTLMIKNIPNKYTSKMLLAAIDERHRGTYDFIYLPIDFKNKCNVGYAFINMTEPSLIVPFYRAFNGKKWEKFNSEKVASLAYGRIQGKPALIAHFQNSSLMNEDKRCRPILFNTDGPNAGDQVPFPMGVNVRSRVGKTRNPTNEESLQDVGNGDGDSSSGSGKEFD